MFSQTAEYALRAAVHLAGAGDGTHTAQVISDHTQIPQNYLSKVLRQLHQAGLLNAQRGPRGGFTLARPASRISLLDVLEAVGAVPRLDQCPLGYPVHEGKLCPLHATLARAVSQVVDSFRNATLADLAAAGDPANPACGFPLRGTAPGSTSRSVGKKEETK